MNGQKQHHQAKFELQKLIQDRNRVSSTINGSTSKGRFWTHYSKNLELTIQANLSYKYNFTPKHGKKTIETILTKQRSQEMISFVDWKDFDQNKEVLKRFYKTKRMTEKLKHFTAYYRYHYEIPRIFLEEFLRVLDRFHDRRREMIFNKVCHEIGKSNIVGCEESTDGDNKGKGKNKEYSYLLEAILKEIDSNKNKSPKLNLRGKRVRINRASADNQLELLLKRVNESSEVSGFLLGNMEPPSPRLLKANHSPGKNKSKGAKKINSFRYGKHGAVILQDENIDGITPITFGGNTNMLTVNSPLKQIRPKFRDSKLNSYSTSSFRLKTMQKAEKMELEPKSSRKEFKSFTDKMNRKSFTSSAKALKERFSPRNPKYHQISQFTRGSWGNLAKPSNDIFNNKHQEKKKELGEVSRSSSTHQNLKKSRNIRKRREFGSFKGVVHSERSKTNKTSNKKKGVKLMKLNLQHSKKKLMKKIVIKSINPRSPPKPKNIISPKFKPFFDKKLLESFRLKTNPVNNLTNTARNFQIKSRSKKGVHPLKASHIDLFSSRKMKDNRGRQQLQLKAKNKGENSWKMRESCQIRSTRAHGTTSSAKLRKSMSTQKVKTHRKLRNRNGAQFIL